MRKLAVSLADSWDLRIILSVFYTIVEVFRSSQEEDSDEFKKIQEEFRTEIGKKQKFCFKSLSYFSSLSYNIHSYNLSSSTNQRRTSGCKTTQYGDQILQWIMSTFPNEESPVASMESVVGLPWGNEGTKRVKRYSFSM